MAKAATEINRSEAIREAFKELPNAKAKEIVAHLKQKGIEVTEGLVYQVKKTSGKKKPGRKPGRASNLPVAQVNSAPAKAHASSNGALSVGASIMLVKATADKVGGMAALKEIVEALQ